VKNPWDWSNDNKEQKNGSSANKRDRKLDDIAKDIFERFKNKAPQRNPAKTLYTICSLILSLWLITGFYKVNSDENAVVLYLGRYYETTTPGLHFFIPYPIGEVIRAGVTRINKEEFGFSTTSHSRDEESLMLTGDENIADIDFEVQWKIDNIKDYLFNIKDPQRTIRSATESVMREIIANRKIDGILANEKLGIEIEAKDLLQSILNSYNSGIEIVTLQLLRADPPRDVIAAFRDVQTAKADKERKINEAESYKNDIMPKARAEAETILQEAEAHRKTVIARAEGETERFNKIYQEYKMNKDVTKKRIYIETIEEIMKNNDKIIIDKSISGNVIQLLNDKKDN